MIGIRSVLRKLQNIFYRIYNYCLFKSKNVKYDEFPIIRGFLSIRGNGKLKLGKKIKIISKFSVNPVGLTNFTAFYIGPLGTIKIGDNVGISTSLIYCLNNIIIEDNVLIGGGCQIFDQDFHQINYQDRIENKQPILTKPVIIGMGAFIGTNTIILKGVQIGKRSVIGAGSVVSKNVPDDEVWGGNPAKFIKKLKGPLVSS